MTEEKSNAGQGLGIAGLILGIIALIISFIPCLGMYALVPGIIGIILAAIGLSQANKSNGAKGLVIAALVLSILGSMIAGYQWYAISRVVSSVTGIENFMEDYSENIEELSNQLEGLNEELEADLEESSEELKELNINNIDFSKKLSDEQFDKIMVAYEGTLKDYVKVIEKAESGDLSVLGSSLTLVTKLTLIGSKLAIAAPHLTEEQAERIDEMNERFDEASK